MSRGVESGHEGGDAACWLDQVCAGCGRIPDERGVLDEDGRCVACRSDAVPPAAGRPGHRADPSAR